MTDRNIVIGNIHGCFVEFMTLLEVVGLRDNDLVMSAGMLCTGDQTHPKFSAFSVTVRTRCL